MTDQPRPTPGAALRAEMIEDIRAIVTAMREFERTAPSPQQTRTKSAREMVGYFAWALEEALKSAALPPEGRPPEDTDEERDIRALADKLEQAWRDGGVMRSHAGDLKLAADKLRILLAALNHAVKTVADSRAEGR